MSTPTPTVQSSVAGNPQQSAIAHSKHSSSTGARANQLLAGGTNNKRRGNRSRGSKNTKRARHAKTKKIFGGNQEVPK